ncbi:MAG TPA: hypothetical protein ENH28_06800 [Euryarchaeota archaeon]|nr:hypothetical protein BMS3Bbin15_01763 [archaeon BMS3Bbin15]HDL15839.1 hypothetical protein [Euryarchaeota archaeon]
MRKIFIISLMVLTITLLFSGCTHKSSKEFWVHFQNADNHITKSTALRGEIVASIQSNDYDNADKLLAIKMGYDKLSIKELTEASKNTDDRNLKEFLEYMKKSVEFMKLDDNKLSDAIKTGRDGNSGETTEYLNDALKYRNQAGETLKKARSLYWVDDSKK